jgi:hydroxymethylglutaryl-CoA lyase
MRLPSAIHIREVSPRDGLQAEPAIISTDDKVRLVDRLTAAGFRHINVTSFVSPHAVPQLADAADVLARIARKPGVVYDVSVPNVRGAERAIEHRADAVSIFVSASDEASRRNVRRSRDEALAEAERAIATARGAGLDVIGTLANAFGSPYGENIPLDLVLRLSDRLVGAGITTLALGDTSGEGTPRQVHEWVSGVSEHFPEVQLALHLHDTRGAALANVVAAMDAGATRFDSAVGGLGGSPFTKDAAGNLCTEDLISICERGGVETGVRWVDCVAVSHLAARLVGRELPGRSARLLRSEETLSSAGPDRVDV